MKHLSRISFLVLLAAATSSGLAAKGKQAQAPQPDMCIVPPGAQPLLPAKLLPGMGVTKDFPVTTTSEEARKFFLQGVSQIHSFWFQESERSCTQALELDKDMAMAHWCIALSAASDYRPAFQLLRDPSNGGGGRAAAAAEPSADATIARSTSGAAIDPQVRAREAIARAMALRDKVTPRERLYIEAQAARRATGPREAADAAYIAGMRKLVAAYPDDLEAKSMLGLAIDNGFEAASKQPREHTMEAIALLEEVVAKDDGQFGAHHYLIHAYEGSKMPEKAWHANQRYAGLVTNIPHALHMPGHIYAQSDKIQEAISAFSAAAANEQKWLASDSLYPNGHYGHNVHFLIHALNLGGRYDDSLKWVQDLFTYKENPRERNGNNQRTAWRQGYFGLIKSTVRFEKWNEILDGKTLPIYDKPEQNAWRHWAMGLAYSANGQADQAKATLAELHKDLDAVTSAKEPLGIAAQELEATIAARAGDRKKAYELYRKAADREANILYTEPPAYPRPVVEGWANVALALGDYATAEKSYREALEREPGSGRAFFGLAASLEGLGNSTEARTARERAAKAWANADANLPQVQKLRYQHRRRGAALAEVGLRTQNWITSDEPARTEGGSRVFSLLESETSVLQHVLHVYSMNLGFAKRLVGDLTEDQMCAQPHGVVNHPAWSLGHLAVAADHLGKILGLNSDLPGGWSDTFKTGGTPSPDKNLFPGQDDLLRVLAEQHVRVAQRFSDADPAALAAPHPNEKSRAHFPTVGDYAIFLMTAHEMDHLGQIAAWRRAMGLGAPS